MVSIYFFFIIFPHKKINVYPCLSANVVPILISGVIIGSCTIFIKAKKYQDRNIVMAVIPSSYGTQARNTALLGSWQSFALAVIILLLLIIFTIPAYYGSNVSSQLYFLVHIIPSIVFPLFFFSSNPKIIKPALESIKLFVNDLL